jgi:hypothetical protein
LRSLPILEKIKQVISLFCTQGETTALATEKVEVYVLDVRVPKQDSQRIRVEKELSLGSDSGCDIRIQEFGLAPLQGRFRLQNNVLTFTQLGPDDSLKVGSQKCGHGRMYILDKGDKCIIDKVKIIVRKEKVEIEKEDEADLDELENETAHEEAHQDEQAEEHDIDSGGTLQKVEDPQNESDEAEYEIVEEVVYVDEEGNEVKEKSEPTFVSKFRNLIKKKEEKRKKPITPKLSAAPRFTKGAKIRDPIAGPLFRLLGIGYNLAFFYGFYTMVLPLIKEKTGFDLLNYGNKAFDIIKPHLGKLPQTLPEAVAAVPYVGDVYQVIFETINDPLIYQLIIAFLCYEILFQFFLGIGLGQFLIGLSNGGHHILNRVLSPIRVLLGIILLPLLVFDLPIIGGKRSFKEILTFSRYERRSLGLTIILAFVVMPTLAILAANYTLYSAYFEITKPIVMSERKAQAPSAQYKDSLTQIETLSFGSKGRVILEKNMRIIPSLAVKGNVVEPKMIAADFLKAKQTEVVLKKELLSKKEILSIIQKDPFLPLFFPDLSLAVKAMNQKKKYPVNTQELMKVIFYSLSLDVKKPWLTAMKVGPILSPYYELQTLVFAKVNAKRIDSAELIEGPLENMIHLGNSDKLANHYILRLSSDFLDVMNFTYTSENQEINKSLMEKVFFLTGPYNSNYKKLMDRAKKLKQGHEKALKEEGADEKAQQIEYLNQRAFLVLDIFEKLAERKEKSTQEERKLIDRFFFDLAFEALSSKNDDYQQIVIDNFVALDKAIATIVNKTIDGDLNRLRSDLLNLYQTKLNKRELKFFDLNK